MQSSEAVLCEDRLSWQRLPTLWAKQLLVILLSIVVMASSTPKTPLVTRIAWLVIVVASIQMVWKLLIWWHTCYLITEKRLVLVQGVLRREVHSIPRAKITHVIFTQTVMQRLIQHGIVHVDIAGTADPIVFRNLSRPLKFHDVLAPRTTDGAPAGQIDDTVVMY